ncbi:hypothetical protein [Marinomonas spartinae]|uniref:hypothetical protein n=1 Tax=Marinomonas spartinae TaxID=1792290 RepID=UPI0018F14828|nr:hypothetical protein [Marinomonas spartinae]MBJ7553154.1 hypothetical protein [Marinomonas spartinae]
MDYPKRDDLPNGRFTDGDPAHNILASRDSAEQMNAVYDEIRAAIQAGGLTPDVNDNTQLSKVLKQFVAKNVQGDGLGNTVSGIRGEITTEDFFVDRKPGLYKVQNASSSPNPNRPPVDTWGGSELYGTLMVDRCEFFGEKRAVMMFTSTESEMFCCCSNADSYGEWVAITPYHQRSHIKVASGSENAIVLTSQPGEKKVKLFKGDDEFQFYVPLTNTTGAVSLAIDGIGPVSIANVVNANQLIKGALATVRFLEGKFWLVRQVNPKTGNDVKDIGKLIVDTTDHVESGEIMLDGSSLSRAEHPIYWAKVQTISNLIDQSQKNTDPQAYAGYYGTGDGITTFTIPTLSGEFIRGYDNGRGVDVGRVFGAFQNDEFGSHSHQAGAAGNSSAIGDISFSGWRAWVKGGGVSQLDATGDEINALTMSGGNETRPRNIAYFFKTRL